MQSRCALLRLGRTPWQHAWQLQERIAADVRAGADPVLLLLEHPHTYTLGSRGNSDHLLLSDDAYRARGAEVHRTDRGGDVTYHGPGQLVGYPILDLRALNLGPIGYVAALESLLIDALAAFGIAGQRSGRNRGVWIGDAKIAAIGVHISRGVATHGFALNVTTDLSRFADIVPCGLTDGRVTSMQQLTGTAFAMQDVEDAVAASFARTFGVEFQNASRYETGALVGS